MASKTTSAILVFRHQPQWPWPTSHHESHCRFAVTKARHPDRIEFPVPVSIRIGIAIFGVVSGISVLILPAVRHFGSDLQRSKPADKAEGCLLFFSYQPL
jgi:hypothetical protein